MLSQQEQIKLILEYKKTGCRRSQHDLIESCRPYVVKYAHNSYRENSGYDEEDLVSEGICGLLIALERFDLSNKNSFLTYAHWYMKMKILRYIKKNHSVVSIPIGRVVEMQDIKKISDQFFIDYFRNPSVDEISELSGLSRFNVVSHLALMTDVSELSRKLKIESKNDMNPADSLIEAEMLELLDSNLLELSEEERSIIFDRFGLNGKIKSLKKVGKRLDISHEWVRMCEKKILNKLKEKLEK